MSKRPTAERLARLRYRNADAPRADVRDLLAEVDHLTSDLHDAEDELRQWKNGDTWRKAMAALRALVVGHRMCCLIDTCLTCGPALRAAEALLEKQNE